MKKRNFIAGLLVLLLVSFGLILGCEGPVGPEGAPGPQGPVGPQGPEYSDAHVINILSFNDFHGTVDKSASTSNPGADRFTAIVKELMSRFPNSVLLAAGDNYQGSPLSNVFLGEPVSEMMRYLGVTHSALGNHEFDWGTDNILKFAKDGGIPFLAANVFVDGKDYQPAFCSPYDILTVAGKKIGLVGLITVETPSIVKAENVAGLKFREPGDWLTEIVTDLKDNKGCDLVIALTHLPGGANSNSSESAEPDPDSECGKLAAGNHGFDAIIGGHQHTLICGEINNTPIVVANYNGRGVGRLEITYGDDGNLLSIVPSVYGKNEMNLSNILPGAANSSDLSASYNTPSKTGVVNGYIKNIIGYFNALAGDTFNATHGEYGVAIADRADQAKWANKLVFDYIQRITSEDYILFQNWGGWRETSYGKSATDTVTYRFLCTLMPFDNEIVLLKMTGEKILVLLNQGSGTGLYPNAEDPVVTGVTKVGDDWIVDETSEAIDPDAVYNVACNDFMLTGGDNYKFPGNYIGDYVFMGIPFRDAMVDELDYRAGIGAYAP